MFKTYKQRSKMSFVKVLEIISLCSFGHLNIKQCLDEYLLAFIEACAFME